MSRGGWRGTLSDDTGVTPSLDTLWEEDSELSVTEEEERKTNVKRRTGLFNKFSLILSLSSSASRVPGGPN